MDKLSTTASLNNSVFEFMRANWCWLGVGISVNPPAAARHDLLMTEPLKDGENTTLKLSLLHIATTHGHGTYLHRQALK